MTDNTHPAFELIRQETIDSLNLTAFEYKHKKTGAMHYHLACDNPENVFLVALRTIPTDSTGVAHILEHTALCGSEKYPVRDPFFMMIRRSLNTFMNAFTSSDWTGYPFASQNKKDFNNLLDVYLDAVFFSRLDPLDFAQEGHRVEFEKIDDADSDLQFKGVVFNEMKGAMSSPVSTLWQTLTSHLFPTTTYHYNSGGEPEDIPDLTHDQLKSFYQKHYHPSNANFFTFGDIPASEHQAKFEEQVLSRFDESPERIEVFDEMRFDAPINVSESYAYDDGDNSKDKTHIVLGWLLGQSSNHRDCLRAQLLSEVLLDNSASPLMKALETTKLGSAPSPLCGLEDSNREMSFICGLEGSNASEAAALEKLVLSVLKEVADNGVPQEKIESVLHQLELSQREITGGSYPYGLQLILATLPAAIHRGDPIELLNVDAGLAELRKDIQDPNFIQNLVRELLLDNPHRVRMVLKPDANLSTQKEEDEKSRLAQIKSGLNAQEKQAIIDRAHALLERQAKDDDPSILPKVAVEDVPEKTYVAEGRDQTSDSLNISEYAQGTNGLIYQDIVLDLPQFEGEQLALLPYYSSLVSELGAGEKDYLAMQEWQSNVCGGFNSAPSLRSDVNDVQAVKAKMIYSGKALKRNANALNELMQTTLTDLRFDEYDRMREIIAQMRASREQSITGSGHVLAMNAACSGLSPIAALNHRLSGLEGIAFIKQLDTDLQDDKAIRAFSNTIQSIHDNLQNAPKELLLIAEMDALSDLNQVVKQYWQNSGASNFNAFALPAVMKKTQQMWITNTQVNFCAKAFPTVSYAHPDAAPLAVLGGFLRNGYLHRAIREQGGAYGGGASHDSDIGAFRFYSYRDPRMQETLDDFDKSLDWLASDKHEWRMVEEAILGVVSGLDKPGAPAGEARKAYYNRQFGREKAREQYRDNILKVTLGDLQRVADTYLQADKASVAVVTNAAMHEERGDMGLEIVKLL